MKLSIENLEKRTFWEKKGYTLPRFDVRAVAQRTAEKPGWFHFGAGNIFRAFPAVLQQSLLNDGLTDTGIIACKVFDDDVVDRVFRAHDNLSIAVTLKATGEVDKAVVASVTETVKPQAEFSRLVEIFSAPSLQIVSLTITEKGYAVTDAGGQLLPGVAGDLESPSRIPSGTIGLLSRLCYERYKAGRYPVALVSLDNFSHNGTVLRDAVMTFVGGWIDRGFCDPGFREYMADEHLISFNWSMIDKITPGPSKSVLRILEEDGLEDMECIRTAKGSSIAPFVNAEETEYLAVENTFPNGRPPLEKAGVLFSDRRTIDRIERMKVCTCLNPLHTVLAVFGCLLGYTSISEEMKDPLLKGFIEQVGYVEGMPVVADPGIIRAQDFIRETIEIRFPNPFLPDSPQRIATDTSKKIPIRFGETLKTYAGNRKADLPSLTFIPLFIAGWLRYLMGIDDRGNSFELSPDPNLEEMTSYVSGISLGDPGPFFEILKPLLSRADVFGIDLCEYGLGEKVVLLFSELNKKPGAVSETLEYYLKKFGNDVSIKKAGE